MKEKSLSFNHRPDPVLGAALRQALSPEGHSPFVSRVMTALAAPRVVHWDVLAAWARPGIAAACVAAVGVGLWLGVMQLPTPVDLVEAAAGPSAQEVVATVVPPDPAFVLVSAELP
jgi:hypothetical protein